MAVCGHRRHIAAAIRYIGRSSTDPEKSIKRAPLVTKKLPRILIVDDDPDNCANLSDILMDAGFETETAASGELALRKIQVDSNGDRPISLCLLDFKMPGMDGVELVEQLRNRIPGLPAIMITAYAGDDGVQRALAAGTSQVLSKPVDIETLLRMIDEAVNR